MSLIDESQSDQDTPSLARQWIAAFNAHDVEAIVALYHQDAELNDAGMKYPRRGKQAIRTWFEQRFSSMPTITYTPNEYLYTSETRAVVAWTTHGQSPAPRGSRWLRWLSRPFQVDGVSVFILSDGLIARQRGYYDHLTVVQQIVPMLRWLLPVRF
ncbi:nuclear transport factor 2 family protein [Dictyobacter aurantiacus]|uniref:SnoaL-like domain-containing protein n=1 Tax=Dictyobacter aurantiacus TaxID=1936993 RepID=A0A401ZFX0_9CHLR|nr:nuclear transport factor 2 family protein [Dictyobacter aurantiacus]GCE05784.1 hypothetical protein KDAU_31130 [Dictyobacter aurantiacus]